MKLSMPWPLRMPTAANVVKLRYFVGMTIPEIAEALEISPRSADRHWVFARAWLKGFLKLGIH